jgi:hypothetical protein
MCCRKSAFWKRISTTWQVRSWDLIKSSTNPVDADELGSIIDSISYDALILISSLLLA